MGRPERESNGASRRPGPPKIGETITTESGLVYKFTQLGKGPQPQTGDLMVIHGIGTLADGKEFWNTRTEGSPYEYTLGVDSVIRGFSEGMRTCARAIASSSR